MAYPQQNNIQSKKEYIIHTSTWMNLENIILIERRQTKDHALYNSVFVKDPEQADSQRKKVD